MVIQFVSSSRGLEKFSFCENKDTVRVYTKSKFRQLLPIFALQCTQISFSRKLNNAFSWQSSVHGTEEDSNVLQISYRGESYTRPDYSLPDRNRESLAERNRDSAAYSPVIYSSKVVTEESLKGPPTYEERINSVLRDRWGNYLHFLQFYFSLHFVMGHTFANIYMPNVQLSAYPSNSFKIKKTERKEHIPVQCKL